jgi:probable HAF family extracellular repeat protein
MNKWDGVARQAERKTTTLVLLQRLLRAAVVASAVSGVAAQPLSVEVLATPAIQYRYSIYDLGAVEDGISVARSVSSNGKAAGQAYFNIGGGYRPALFDVDAPPKVIFTDSFAEATGVNARGEVVGWGADGNGYEKSFFWRDDVLTVLPTLGGGSTVALAINDRSQVVGWSHAPGLQKHAFLFENNTMTDLGTWGGLQAQATAINQAGDVAGFRQVYREYPTVAAEGVRIVRGKFQTIESLVGAYAAIPRSINLAGDIAGQLHETQSSDISAFALIGKKAYRLTPGSTQSSASSINDSGQVVGYYALTGVGDRVRAFLWEKGRLVDLTGLPEVQAAGWTWLQEASAINNDGVIVGGGITATGAFRAFMLVPIKKSKR